MPGAAAVARPEREPGDADDEEDDPEPGEAGAGDRRRVAMAAQRVDRADAARPPGGLERGRDGHEDADADGQRDRHDFERGCRGRDAAERCRLAGEGAAEPDREQVPDDDAEDGTGRRRGRAPAARSATPTWRRVAPAARRSAISRIRSARVIESVL